MPPPKCTKCHKNLTARNFPGVICIGCDEALHFKCSKIKESQWPLYSEKPEPKTYNCPKCEAKKRRSASFSTLDSTASVTEVPPPQAPTTPKVLQAPDELAELRKLLEQVLTDLAAAKGQISDLEAQLKRHTASTENSIKGAPAKKAETQETPEKTIFFTINGVPETPDEDVIKITEAVLSNTAADSKVDETTTVRRLKTKLPNHHTILIGVRRNSPLLKVLNKARGKSFKGGEVNLPAEKVFVNESHPSQTYRLFRKSKQLKAKGYKSVWIRGSRVFARKTTESNQIVIRNEEDLQKLLTPDT